MKYNFEKVNIKKIKEKFGENFYSKVENLINPSIDKWCIDELSLIQSYSANLVFKGYSKKHGSIVLKFGRDYGEFSSEVAMLQSFNNEAVSKIFDVDHENMVFIMEAIEPGEELSTEKNMALRLDVFSALHKELHQGEASVNALNKQSYDYKTYEEWVTSITKYMKKRNGWEELASLMENAETLFYELSNNYSDKRLLHGDLHYYNILKGQKGYKAIDPKGVIGDPLFDTPRYILNEFCDEEDKSKIDETITEVVDVISRDLGYEKNDLWKALYVESTMAMCWNVESGADISEQDKFLETIHLLKEYL